MAGSLSIKVDNNIKLNPEVRDFLNPKYIFIPIKDGYKLKVKDKAYVYKNDIVMYKGNNESVRTPISGVVLGVKDMLYADGKNHPSLMIENDFKEAAKDKRSSQKYIEKYTFEEFNDLLREVALGDILKRLFRDEDILLINAIEIDPNFGNKLYLMKDHVEEILDVIDLIMNLYDKKKTIIAVKNEDTEVINEFYNLLGKYPNIEIKPLNNVYPLGINSVLENKLKIKPITFSIGEIRNLYSILKRRKPYLERYITITGDAVSPREVVHVKKGTLLSEVFMNSFDFKEPRVDVYLNGYVNGKVIDTLNIVIDDEVDGIFITKEKDKTMKACINCGLCAKYCPMKINPKYVLDKKGKVDEKYVEKCLDCGLCNYVCPSNINLRKMIKGDDND